MALRFRQSLRLPAGLRLNLSGSGVGISAGGKGFRVGVDARGRAYRNLSLPGTGLSARQYYRRSQDATGGVRVRPGPLGWLVLILVACYALAHCGGHRY